jgi:hypothetical protein
MTARKAALADDEPYCQVAQRRVVDGEADDDVGVVIVLGYDVGRMRTVDGSNGRSLWPWRAYP